MVCALGGAVCGQEAAPVEQEAVPVKEETEGAAEESEFPKEVEAGEVRFRFPQERDGEGHYWGVSGSGVVEWSSGSMQSAMAMKVRGVAFEAEKAEEIGRGHYLISGRAGDVEVVRDVRLDLQRGVVRYWDQFRPTAGGVDVAVVEYLTVPAGKPAEVLTSSGAALGKRLGDDDFGVVLRNDPGVAGRTSAVLVFGGTREVVRPAVVWADDPVLRVVYKVKLEAGESRGVVVVVGQRKVAAGGEVKGVFQDLFWRQSLFGAAIPEAGIAGVVNFVATSLSGEGVMAPHADDLVGVVDVERRLGVERSVSDVLWVSDDSQLTGKASGGKVTLSGALGDLSVGFSAVAAMQGGGGLGRQHRLYLRDGTVLGGTVEVDDLRIAGTQGWRIDADLEQLDHLLLRLAEEDGVAPEGTGMFAKLHSGDVLPLVLDGAPVLPFVTPWGAVDVPAEQIEVLVYVKVP
ncbi:MAG: hypothetical protein P8J87_04945, partial [Verrucomicrobiales bacterium]|nr:hypothetical protein [Verrucomicrobiales bacterium]